MKVRISTALATEFRTKDGLINPPDNFIAAYLGKPIVAVSSSKRLDNVKVKRYQFVDLKSMESLDLEGKTIDVKEQ
jgi:hypothetical protein